MKDKKKNLIIIIFMGILMAFVGFVTENASLFISHGQIDSRYYVLPFISSYSLIVFTWYFLYVKFPKLLDFENPPIKKSLYYIALISSLCFAVFIIEIFYGHLIDKLFNVSLWSYEDIPLHITKFASIPTSIGFGLGAFVLVRWVYPKTYTYLQNHANIKVLKIIDIILGSLIILDLIIFYINLALYNRTVIYWRLL